MHGLVWTLQIAPTVAHTQVLHTNPRLHKLTVPMCQGCHRLLSAQHAALRPLLFNKPSRKSRGHDAGHTSQVALLAISGRLLRFINNLPRDKLDKDQCAMMGLTASYLRFIHQGSEKSSCRRGEKCFQPWREEHPQGAVHRPRICMKVY